MAGIPEHTGHTSLNQNQCASIYTGLHNTPQTVNELPYQTSKTIRQAKEPDKFDGKSIEWKYYLVHFEQVAMWNQWSGTEKAQQLAMSLRGQAQKLLSDLNPIELQNYENLRNILSQRYDPQERGVAHRCECRVRNRNKNETPAEFAYSLRRIACLAFPDMPYQFREINVLEQFLNGIGSSDVREHIIFHHPKTVEQTISLTIEYEAVKGSQVFPSKPHSNIDEGYVHTLKQKQNRATKLIQQQTQIQN
ncbi:MAG: hypothetical protein ABW168_10735 [Sedimenticola sp.]